MKPIAKIGDYLISYFDEDDNEVAQEISQEGMLGSKEIAASKEFASYRIAKIVANSKYDAWGVK